MQIKFDLSGLDRLQHVLSRIGGDRSYTFHCDGTDVFASLDKKALAKEAIETLLGSAEAQEDFLRSGSFSYHSQLAGQQITVTQAET